MTLNITFVSSDIVFQVSDRRFTDLRTMKLVNDKGNKALVIGCRDGIATITFTGLAEFTADGRSRRLDRWLAEEMQDARIPDGGLADAVAFVADASTGLFNRLSPPRAMEHAFVVAGWLYGSSPEARAWVVSNRATGGGPFMIEPPFSPRRSVAGIQVTGLRDALTRSIRRRLSRALRGQNTPDTTEAALVGAIREAAANAAGIGKDCMAIALSSSREVRATFYPESSNAHTFGPLCLWKDGTASVLAGDFDVSPGYGYPMAVGGNSCPFRVVLGQRGHQAVPTEPEHVVLEGSIRVGGPLSPGEEGTILEIRRPGADAEVATSR